MYRIRFNIIIAALTLNINLLLAAEVPGYIVTNTSDTIMGEIKVLRFDSYTGGLSLFGINLASFHSFLRFREEGNRRFASFAPGDIAGFGFCYKSTNFKFKAFMIEANSIVEAESIRPRFLNLVFQGEIAIYKDIVRMDNFIKAHAPHDRFIDHYDYYLFAPEYGLQRAVRTKQYTTVADLLKAFELDDGFLQLLPFNARFKDIIYILQAYERWKDNL